MKFYKVKVKKIKHPVIYYIISILLSLNLFFYSIIAYKDYTYSQNLNHSYKNLLSPSTKKVLSKKIKDIKFEEFINKVINKEYTIYWIYPLFIDFIMKKNIKTEIKYNLVIYTVDIFKNIKKSSLLLDLEIYIHSYWNYDKKDILKKIKKTLSIDNNLVNHKLLLSKKMVELYSKHIIEFYKPKTLSESNSYFYYLLRTKNYKKIIDYINNNKINIDIKILDKSMAANIIKIGDFEKSEKIMLDLIKKEKIDYLYYYLSLLYIDNNKMAKAIDILEQIKTLPKYNSWYLIVLADLYNKNKNYLKAIDSIFSTNNLIIKKYCSRYIYYVNKLTIGEREKFFKKVEYICDKKQIYTVLSRYYKEIGKIDKYDFYNLEINMIK